jgi:hypothetical protein
MALISIANSQEKKVVSPKNDKAINEKAIEKSKR